MIKFTTKPKTSKVISEAVGSHGIFSANPPVVRFAGFESNKTHTIKLRLLNTTAAPQKLHIIGPQTPKFKIRFAKKGMIPSGVN